MNDHYDYESQLDIPLGYALVPVEGCNDSHDSCKGCYFKNKSCAYMVCVGSRRSDGKYHIIYRLVPYKRINNMVKCIVCQKEEPLQNCNSFKLENEDCCSQNEEETLSICLSCAEDAAREKAQKFHGLSKLGDEIKRDK